MLKGYIIFVLGISGSRFYYTGIQRCGKAVFSSEDKQDAEVLNVDEAIKISDRIIYSGGIAVVEPILYFN